MRDTEIAEGARCVLDANILIYAEQGHSKQASALLARCAEGAVSGVIPFAALLEVCHKLMLIEARARNRGAELSVVIVDDVDIPKGAAR